MMSKHIHLIARKGFVKYGRYQENKTGGDGSEVRENPGKKWRVATMMLHNAHSVDPKPHEHSSERLS